MVTFLVPERVYCARPRRGVAAVNRSELSYDIEGENPSNVNPMNV